MKRHLKLQAKLSLDGKTASVTVIEQTHFSYQFGPPNLNRYSTDRFHIPNGDKRFMLFATGMRSRFQVGGDTFVCVNIREPGPFDIPAEEWPRIKKLVEAYNEWGDKQ